MTGVTSLQVEVLERGDRVVFLHRVVPGAADRSYGVHVARLAGVPEPVTRRAASILRDLERTRDGGGHDTLGNGAAGENDGEATKLASGQIEALRRLGTLEPLRMSPIEALSELMTLVDLATGTDREPPT